MRDFITLGKRKVVLGMIHLQPLPGTLFYQEDSFNHTLETAVQSARALYDGGADGCLMQTGEGVCRHWAWDGKDGDTRVDLTT